MTHVLNQENTIYDQFIQAYYTMFDKIIEQLQEKSLETQLEINQAYYCVVKELLLSEYIIHTNDFQ
ncbi:MAG: hypothetical protein ACTSPC_06705 [Candidatus Heimdallarchaeota archaeon]